MAIYDRLQSAFEEHLASCPDLPSGGVAWENVKFEAPGPTAKWARCKFDPVASVRHGLGEGGHSRIDGLFSVWLYYPLGVGTQESAIVADQLVKHFKSATQLESGGVYASIVSATRKSGGTEGGWWVTPIIISWYAHSTEV